MVSKETVAASEDSLLAEHTGSTVDFCHQETDMASFSQELLPATISDLNLSINLQDLGLHAGMHTQEANTRLGLAEAATSGWLG